MRDFGELAAHIHDASDDGEGRGGGSGPSIM
jgi:hypothetical protein